MRMIVPVIVMIDDNDNGNNGHDDGHDDYHSVIIIVLNAIHLFIHPFIHLSQEWNVVKKNKFGRKQERVFGVDGKKVYNSKKGAYCIGE